MSIRKATDILEADQINFTPNPYISDQQIPSIKKRLTRVSALRSKLPNLKKAEQSRLVTANDKGLNVSRDQDLLKQHWLNETRVYSMI